MVYLGADHRGYDLKEKVRVYLEEHEIKYKDLGAQVHESGDDYTVYASRVAEEVSQHHSSRGIVFCGSGVGVSVVANKFDGIRAAIGMDVEQIKKGREDDDMNVLVLAADFTDPQKATDIVDAFLSEDYEANERHERRLEHIKQIEENN